jgi:hypothetical protein
MTSPLNLNLRDYQIQWPSVALTKAALIKLPKRCADHLARFILYTGLRGAVALAAYRAVQWGLKSSTWDKKLEAYAITKLKAPVAAFKSIYLKEISAGILEHASMNMTYIEQFFLRWKPPKIEEYLDCSHVYAGIHEIGLTVTSSCIAKLIVGGSLFDSLCSGLIVRVSLVVYAVMIADTAKKRS